MTMIFDIDYPDFLSCRHFPTEQEVFYNLQLAALLLLNTNIYIYIYIYMYLTNEIPSYLIVVRRWYTTLGKLNNDVLEIIW
jgi:hypothetical protein